MVRWGERQKWSPFLLAELHWLEDEERGEFLQREAPLPEWFRQRCSGSPPRGAGRRKLRAFPLFHASRVLMQAGKWRRLFSRHLGQAAAAILDGRLELQLESY